MTKRLMRELKPGKLAHIVDKMDAIEWYRFFTSLTEAHSAEGVLAWGRYSFTSIFRAGNRLLEGADFRQADGQQDSADAAVQVPADGADGPDGEDGPPDPAAVAWVDGLRQVGS